MPSLVRECAYLSVVRHSTSPNPIRATPKTGQHGPNVWTPTTPYFNGGVGKRHTGGAEALRTVPLFGGLLFLGAVLLVEVSGDLSNLGLLNVSA